MRGAVVKIKRALQLLVTVSSFSFIPQYGIAADVEKAPSEHGGLADALFGGDFGIELRYRYQFLDDEAFDLDGHASTLRALIHYETKPVHGVSFLGELRAVQRIASGDLFNDTLNGNINRPVIADPEEAEIDQALLKFDNIVPDTTVTVGRRKIALNNQRFISTLPFRQNANSFDGVVLENTFIPDLYLHYSYAFNFNRAFTDDSPVGNFDEANFHLFHGEYTFDERLKLIGYGYLLGIEEASFAGASNLATNTFGVNAKGKFALSEKVHFHYDVEYANQTDNSENSRDFNLNYFRVQPGISYGPWQLNVGYEVLGGDGIQGFSTPLALLHAFNGYADVFVVTPPDGLEDFYVNLTYKPTYDGLKIGDYDLLKDSAFHVAFHRFDAEDSGLDYGYEIDASFKKKLAKNLSLVLEYAHYKADFDGPVTPASPRFTRDVDQFYTQLVFKY